MAALDKYGPWVLITGASEGTGRCFAHKVASEGLNCILLARREAPLTEVANELREQYGVDVVTASIDLYSSDAFEKIVEVTGEREVGLLINNSGGDPYSSCFLDLPVDNWLGLINRNVTTIVRCCHHFGGQMRDRKRGGIILVGSGACYGGSSFMSIYSGTKAFDLCFGEGLWIELKDYGVDVLNMILGRTDTPALREVLDNNNLPVPDDLASPEDVVELALKRLPYGPVCNWGQEDDESGFAMSAADRRKRVEFINAASRDIFGGDD